ncbi:MAG TPA: hypothetical protein VGI64_01235 [Streptosporangiaceae bacterium]
MLPGRLYAFDYPAFLDTLDRMVQLATSRPVTHVMGCHIEMTTTSGRDYPLGCLYQPDEPPLQMTVRQLVSVRDQARSAAGRRGRHVFADVLIFNEMPKSVVAGMMLRGLWGKIRPPRAAAGTQQAR